MLARQMPTCAGATLRTVPRSALLARRAARRRDGAAVRRAVATATSTRCAHATRTTSSIVDVPLERDGPDRYELAARRMTRVDRRGRAGRATRRPRSRCTACEFTDEAGTPASTVGVIGALEVVDEGAGGVLPHERTTPKAKTDRLDLTRATRGQPVADLGPVADRRASRDLLQRARRDRSARCTDEDGVVHTVERSTIPPGVGGDRRSRRRRTPC